MESSTGKILAEFESEKSLTPASTMKAITTATAIAVLGCDYTFDTKLEYDGTLDTNGTLKGNLYITGGGDPTLGSDRIEHNLTYNELFEEWSRIIQSKGIKKIEGAIIADAQIFDDNVLPGDYVWNDIGNYYGAGCFGLNINENLYYLHFRTPSRSGMPTTIKRIEPEVPGLDITNKVITGGSGDNSYIYGAPFTNERVIQGTIPAGRSDFEVKGSMPDPAYFCAFTLNKILESEGVDVCKVPETMRLLKKKDAYPDKPRTLLHKTSSPTLDTIAHWTNHKSVNLYAEALLKAVALKESSKGATYEGTLAVESYWKKKGIDLSGFFMQDGSGLSRSNAVTTKQLASILRTMTYHNNFQAFYTSLPVAGRSGTLKWVGRGTPAEGKVRAKSGYMGRVRGYTGYAETKSGQLLTFAVLSNNYTCTTSEMTGKIARLMVRMVEVE